MKKLLIAMAVVAMLLPVAAQAQDACSKEGFEGWYDWFSDYYDDVVYVIKGEVWCTEDISVVNYDWGYGPSCQNPDTVCVHFTSWAGWDITSDPEDGVCWIGDYGFSFGIQVCLEVPCDAEVGDVDTLTAFLAYCDEGVCDSTCNTPCIDLGLPMSMSQAFEIVVSPPALYVLQDSLYLVEQGAVTAYIPFSVCNGDPCADPTTYGYEITKTGTVGGGFPQGGTADNVPGGECLNVYGIIDASEADVCDYDELTIIVWSVDTPVVYDTCVQLVHVVEPVPVPLFTTPVVTILVLSMILAAAVLMKKRAASRA